MAETTKESLDSEIEALMAEAIKEKEEIEGGNSPDGGDDTDNSTNKTDTKDIDENVESTEAKSEDNKEEKDSDVIEVEKEGQKVSIETMKEAKDYIEASRNPNSNILQDFIKKGNIDESDLALLADIKAGKVGAMKKLADRNNLDLVDVDEFEGEYEPEAKMEIRDDIDIVLDNMRADTELATKFDGIVETLPDDFLSVIANDPRDLAAFIGQVKSGVAEELLPEAAKQAALGNGTLIDNYISIGNKKYAGKSKDNSKGRTMTEREKELRNRVSADIDANKSGKASALTVDDLWNEENLLEKVGNGEIDLRELD